MTKVVINTCYGGFGITDEAMKMYLERKGIPYKMVKSEFSTWNHEYFEKADPNQEQEVPDTFDLERDDPVLIEVIEELGLERSAGPYAKLEIEDIPKGTLYRIEEYDGREWIEYKDSVDWKMA